MENRPIFWNKALEIFNLISIPLSTILGFTVFPKDYSMMEKGVTLLLIYIIVFALSLCINNIIYSIRMWIYCAKIDKNRNALINDNNKYIRKYKQSQTELALREEIIIDMVTFLNATSLEPNDYEKKCLNNLLNNINTKVANIKRKENS